MHFYVLDNLSDGHAVTEASKPDGFNVGDGASCATCGHGIGMLSWHPPFEVELELSGGDFGDFASIAGNDLLVSQRFHAIYREQGLTGLSGFEPVKVTRIRSRRKKLFEPPQYLRAVVARTRTAFDANASRFHWASSSVCPDCRLDGIIMRWQRLIIEAGTWTGEDIFFARGLSGTVMVTERFKEVCETHDVKNVSFLPAESYGYDFYPGLDSLPEH